MTFHRRNEFSKETKRLAFARSRGICECHRIPALKRPDGCGVALRAGHINYEHVDQDALGGSNELSNCAVLARNCWREKTDTIDLPLIAKNNRQRDLVRDIRSTPWRPITGSKASGIKLRIGGGRPLDRSTGREL